MASSLHAVTGHTASGNPPPERLRLRGVRKSFGGTHALRNVSLELKRGEVLALIGENGAGKSTLMKILSGACQPDSGEIFLENQLYCPKDPLHARRHGVEMIYQELNLAPHLTVEENILLGCEPATLGWVRKKERREAAQRALAELQHPNLPLDAPVYSRSIAEQQVIEIARALIGSPRVLIMDEPTSSLTQVDTENLFAAIERLAERGVSIIYISHFLEECLRIADSYVVLRDGETVGAGKMQEADLGEIIHLMVGRELEDIYPKVEHSVGRPVLNVQNLSGKRIPTEISFTLRAGEIFGLAGLVGAGRTETLRTLFGLEPGSVEKIELGGANNSGYTRNRPFSPASALARGIGLLSENRKEEGLMLNLPISDNLTLPRLGPFSKAGLLDAVEQRERAKNWIAKMNVRSRDPSQAIGELSGGNQQKIAIARLLHSQADILLLDEPTRGIDVASKAQIYQLIGELAASGKAIIFVSSYLPELLGVCDTIGVMCRGKLAAVQSASAWTEHTIIATAIGQC